MACSGTNCIRGTFCGRTRPARTALRPPSKRHPNTLSTAPASRGDSATAATNNSVNNSGCANMSAQVLVVTELNHHQRRPHIHPAAPTTHQLRNEQDPLGHRQLIRRITQPEPPDPRTQLLHPRAREQPRDHAPLRQPHTNLLDRNEMPTLATRQASSEPAPTIPLDGLQIRPVLSRFRHHTTLKPHRIPQRNGARAPTTTQADLFGAAVARPSGLASPPHVLK